MIIFFYFRNLNEGYSLLIKSQICEVKGAPRWFVYGGVFPIRFCSLAEKSFGYEFKKNIARTALRGQC